MGRTGTRDLVEAQAIAQKRAGRAVLGIDPANNTGFCLYVEGRFVEDGTLRAVVRQGGAKGVDVIGSYRLFRQLREKYTKRPDGTYIPGTLVVEEQHPLPERHRPDETEEENVKQKSMAYRGMESMFRQVEARQTLECWALLHGWDIERVNPSTWASATLGKKPGVLREELKKRSIARARSLGAKALDDNAADAVNLANWWVSGGQTPAEREKGAKVKANKTARPKKIATRAVRFVSSVTMEAKS